MLISRTNSARPRASAAQSSVRPESRRGDDTAEALVGAGAVSVGRNRGGGVDVGAVGGFDPGELIAAVGRCGGMFDHCRPWGLGRVGPPCPGGGGDRQEGRGGEGAGEYSVQVHDGIASVGAGSRLSVRDWGSSREYGE